MKAGIFNAKEEANGNPAKGDGIIFRQD